MKKLLVIFLLVLTLAACRGNDYDDYDDNDFAHIPPVPSGATPPYSEEEEEIGSEEVHVLPPITITPA